MAALVCSGDNQWSFSSVWALSLIINHHHPYHLFQGDGIQCTIGIHDISFLIQAAFSKRRTIECRPVTPVTESDGAIMHVRRTYSKIKSKKAFRKRFEKNIDNIFLGSQYWMSLNSQHRFIKQYTAMTRPRPSAIAYIRYVSNTKFTRAPVCSLLSGRNLD